MAESVAIGLAASVALVRSLATMLFGVPPFEPLTFAVARAVLTLVAPSSRVSHRRFAHCARIPWRRFASSSTWCPA